MCITILNYFALRFKTHFKDILPTCCRMGLMCRRGNGLNLLCFRKSYRFCSNISNTKQVWPLCWKHSYERTKLYSSAFSALSRFRMPT